MVQSTQFLSYFNWIGFCWYLANIELIKQIQICIKQFNTINWLRCQRFGSPNHGLLNSSIWTGNKAKIKAIPDQHEAERRESTIARDDDKH